MLKFGIRALPTPNDDMILESTIGKVLRGSCIGAAQNRSGGDYDK